MSIERGETTDINSRWEQARNRFRDDLLRNELYQRLLKIKMSGRVPIEYFDPADPQVIIEPVSIAVDQWHNAGIRVSYTPPGSRPIPGMSHSVNEFISVGSYSNATGEIFYSLEGTYSGELGAHTYETPDFTHDESVEIGKVWHDARNIMRDQFTEEEHPQLPTLVHHYAPDWAIEAAPDMANFGNQRLIIWPLP